jgi:hypothetical protein
MISRRQFLSLSQMLGLSVLFQSCDGKKEIPGGIVGANAAVGHRLRTMDFAPIAEYKQVDVVIVGGGVAGLSAARFLKKYTSNFFLLEMDSDVGGNARSGINNISKFPWGAHYLPIPGNTDPELNSFLQECNVITGYKNGLPVYNEYYLCHDPKERLFINHFWQEGIVPHEGVPKKDREEIQRFLELMYGYKMKTGNDYKPAFSIPVELSSRDTDLIRLDSLTAVEFLSNHNLKSPYLHWYVNYCCADDFGSSISETSAWAMIHYFASRKAKAANASSESVLTWPEGNQWLINKMKLKVKEQIVANALVYGVKRSNDGVVCSYFDVSQNVSVQVSAKAVIMATPQFINERVLQDVTRDVDIKSFEYAPWMVANISTRHSLEERKGEPLCWDNVIYGSDALGYVNATHQNIGIPSEKKVITYYKPLLNKSVSLARKQAYTASFDDWKNFIFKDLQKPHPDLRKYVDEINVWIWGHGMIKPAPNFVWSKGLLRANQNIGNKIFFAHSDLSGVSIFEEAFYQGRKAVEMLMES